MPQSACPKWVDGRWGATAMGNNLKMLEMAKDSENSAKNRELRMQGSFNESWRRDEGSENQVCATCIKPGGLIKAGEKNNNSVQSATSLKLQRPKPKKFGLHTGNNFQMFKINQRSRDMIWNENFHKIKNTRLTNLVWTKREPRICVACVQWLMFARRRAGATQKGRELQTGLRDGCHFSFLSFEKTNQTHGYIMDTFVSHTWKRHEVQTGSRNLPFLISFRCKRAKKNSFRCKRAKIVLCEEPFTVHSSTSSDPNLQYPALLLLKQKYRGIRSDLKSTEG